MLLLLTLQDVKCCLFAQVCACRPRRCWDRPSPSALSPCSWWIRWTGPAGAASWNLKSCTKPSSASWRNVNVIISTYGEDESGPMGSIMVRTCARSVRCEVNEVWSVMRNHAPRWWTDEPLTTVSETCADRYIGSFSCTVCAHLSLCFLSDRSSDRYCGFWIRSSRLGLHSEAVCWDVCGQVCR